MKPKQIWKPAFYTPQINKTSDGDDVIAFAEHFLRLTKGVKAHQPLVFTEWQQWLLRAMLERNDSGRLRYKRALVGLPRKQGKSLLGSALALYGLFGGEAGAEVYSAAGDRQQARIVFEEAKHQIQQSPALLAECKVYRDAIEVPSTNAIYRVLSADGKLAQGLNPSLVIFDELHVQRNDDLYDALTMGSGARLDPLVVAITTAGYDLESLCGRLYQYGKQVAAGEVIDPYWGFWWWEADRDCDINDEKQWKKSNPNLVLGLLDKDDLKVSAQQSSEAAMRRFRLNQWVRAQESWLPAGAWENCNNPTAATINAYDPAWVGIDMALKHDSIGIVVAQPHDDGKIAVQAKIFHPDIDGIDIHAIEQHLRSLHNELNIQEFAYDPAFFQRSAEALFDDGLPMIEFPQSSQRMIPACGTTYELIVAKKIAHDGSPMFTDQVLSAAQRMTEQGWRLSKGKSRRKIDACIAMVMAIDRATRRNSGTPQPMIASVW